MQLTSINVYYGGQLAAVFTLCHRDDESWLSLSAKTFRYAHDMGLRYDTLDAERCAETCQRPGWRWVE